MSHEPSASKYKNGCRCEPCRRVHMIAQKRWRMGLTGRLIDSTGTRRRIQALAALGWSMAEIADACGSSNRQWPCEINRSESVHTDTARKVKAAFERMSMTVPEGPMRNRNRLMAARKGWPPPLAWDDIDNPEEVPGDWQRATDDWIADLYDLDEHHIGVSEVCSRLGVSRKSLQKRCERHDLMPLYSRMVAREATRYWSNGRAEGGVA